MARKRPNLFAMTRPLSAEGTRTFTDPAQPGEPLDLSLCVTLDGNIDAQITESHMELLRLYMLGDGEYIDSKGEKGQGPTPLFSPGTSNRIPVSNLQCLRIAELMAYEEAALKAAKAEGGEEWEAFTFPEWLILAERMPTAYRQILDFMDALLNEAAGHSKNLQTESGQPLPGSPLTTASDTTPN